MFISLRTKSLVSHLGIVLAVTFLVTGLTYHLMRHDYLAHEEKNLALIAAIIVEEIDHFLVVHQNILEQIAQSGEIEAVVQGRSTPLLAEHFAKFQKHFPNLLGIDRDGWVRLQIINGRPIDGEENLAGNSNFQTARKAPSGIVIGSVELCPRSGRPVVHFIRAIDRSGFAGAVIGAVSLDDLLHPVQWAEIGRNSFAWIVDEQGRVIAGILPEGPQALFPPVEQVMAKLVGPRDLVKTTAIPGTGWSVMAVLPYEAAMAGPVRVRSLSLLLAIGILVAGSGGAFMLAARITHPLRQLTAAVQQVSRGELKPVPALQVQVQDEVGILVTSFNRMVEDLQRTTVSRDYVDNLLNSMHDSLLVIAPDDRLLTINRGAGAILGHAPADLVGAPAPIVFGAPPAATGSWFETMAADPHRLPIEGDLLARDGRKIPMTLSWSPLTGGDGRVAGMICVAQDMTERKRMEGALRFIAEGVAAETGEGFFRALVDHLAEALQAHAALLAVAVTPTLGRALAFRVGENHLDGLEYDQRTTPCGEVVRSRTSLFIPEQAQEIYPGVANIGAASYLGVPVRDAAGRVFGNLAVMDSQPMLAEPWKQSILQIFAVRAGAELERTENERRLQASAAALVRSNRELEEFAYVASHDLQEPLRKVSVFCDRLRSRYAEALDETGRDYLGRVLDATSRMQNLIDDLLTYSRVTSRAQPFVPVDLAEVSRGVLADLEVRIEQLGAAVEITPLPTIEADPVQMRQLLQNLIGNALKFHRPGIPPTVRIAEVNGEDREACRLSVQDNGIGFDEKYSERIFTVFQRLHGRAEYEGSGVGLAVCRKIAERHGGRIEVHSTPGVGSNFEIILPVRQGKKEEA